MMEAEREMERAAWVRLRRQRSEERMDTLWAPIYDQDWGSYINPSHAAMLERFLERCAPGGIVLDAGCGTGKYWPRIRASGRRVVGYDQSAQMLLKAQAKFPDVPIAKIGLQELESSAAFDGIVSIDALENIYPEDWPVVLANLHRALRPGGPLYFTVELADPAEIAAPYAAGQALGLPVVPGEWAHEGAYHYYPDLAQVRDWTADAGLILLEETTGDDYAHFLTERRAAG